MKDSPSTIRRFRQNWCGRQGSNLRHQVWKTRSLPTEILPQKWWTISGSNRSPPECKSGALPNELMAQKRIPYSATSHRFTCRFRLLGLRIACARANSGKDGGRDRTRTCTPWEKASKTFAAAITPLARNGGSTWTRTKVARRREIYSLLQLPLCHTPKKRRECLVKRLAHLSALSYPISWIAVPFTFCKMAEGNRIERLRFHVLQFSRLCEEPTSVPSLERFLDLYVGNWQSQLLHTNLRFEIR